MNADTAYTVDLIQKGLTLLLKQVVPSKYRSYFKRPDRLGRIHPGNVKRINND